MHMPGSTEAVMRMSGSSKAVVQAPENFWTGDAA